MVPITPHSRVIINNPPQQIATVLHSRKKRRNSIMVPKFTIIIITPKALNTPGIPVLTKLSLGIMPVANPIAYTRHKNRASQIKPLVLSAITVPTAYNPRYNVILIRGSDHIHLSPLFLTVDFKQFSWSFVLHLNLDHGICQPC